MQSQPWLPTGGIDDHHCLKLSFHNELIVVIAFFQPYDVKLFELEISFPKKYPLQVIYSSWSRDPSVVQEKFEDNNWKLLFKERIDNTMAREKRIKIQAMVDKTTHSKLKLEQYELHLKWGWTKVLRKG